MFKERGKEMRAARQSSGMVMSCAISMPWRQEGELGRVDGQGSDMVNSSLGTVTAAKSHKSPAATRGAF
jgi:hypothetical protein